ncbi:hypothetical protein C9374_004619 [Naegleria lovaniensis]|uniref:Uncharacterized protein n=1 Tax=Naegleria lovaniensis TaxID=51637 RepID=A0AA88KJJ2_NAELO|nr:uncharacterized protein C9374_004619 [Naegleria lovaniensis]KAG2383282.1 hypothetical protein C9374_004619 [Naegleria lovaniensis]
MKQSLLEGLNAEGSFLQTGDDVPTTTSSSARKKQIGAYNPQLLSSNQDSTTEPINDEVVDQEIASMSEDQSKRQLEWMYDKNFENNNEASLEEYLVGNKTLDKLVKGGDFVEEDYRTVQEQHMPGALFVHHEAKHHGDDTIDDPLARMKQQSLARMKMLLQNPELLQKELDKRKKEKKKQEKKERKEKRKEKKKEKKEKSKQEKKKEKKKRKDDSDSSYTSYSSEEEVKPKEKKKKKENSEEQKPKSTTLSTQASSSIDTTSKATNDSNVTRQQNLNYEKHQYKERYYGNREYNRDYRYQNNQYNNDRRLGHERGIYRDEPISEEETKKKLEQMMKDGQQREQQKEFNKIKSLKEKEEALTSMPQSSAQSNFLQKTRSDAYLNSNLKKSNR